MTGSERAVWIIHFTEETILRNGNSSLKINNACKKTTKILLFSLMQTWNNEYTQPEGIETATSATHGAYEREGSA